MKVQAARKLTGSYMELHQKATKYIYSVKLDSGPINIIMI